MTNTNLTTLVNSIDDNTLADEARRLKRAVNSCPYEHYFFPVYIAARGDLYNAITDYLAQEIGIPAESRIDLLIPPEVGSYYTILPVLQDRLSTCPSEAVLLSVKGFQYINKLGTEYGISRAAHDFDQALFEDKSFQSDWRVPKRLILAVHLDPQGDKYRGAFESAVSSGFKMGLWRFEQTP